ncbi:MAG: 3-oxoacyl-[acyl-carrier-protein] synthase III C-terminal domain-containing protein [Candidatus Eisenbacteria bacterium]|nr:3-oxoacyl-[acyl-carrier-protein] synthase III C-terminal domain-containing protein [Candidatus Eisenbacteria bacterium]
MDGKESTIGIVSYGIYLPDHFETAEEVAARAGLTFEEVIALGIRRKCRPADEDQPIPMAVKAAKQAFERAGRVRPEEVDLVLWTGEEYKDYIAQTASIRLQEEVECRNAWAFDLVDQGITTILGLRVARDMMIGDRSINTVLLAGGTRNVDLVDYTNPSTWWMLPTSASGGALLLRRGHPANVLQETLFLIDQEMADEVYVPGGGTMHPFSPENLDTEIMHYHTPNPPIVSSYLSLRFAKRLIEVIRSAAEAEKSVDYLALRHLHPRDREQVLRELNLTNEQSEPLEEVGHHGTNDPLISVDLALKRGRISDGARVVLASAGIGFSYAAAVILWGRK